MAYLYSFGIAFDSEKKADESLKKLISSGIQLSDGKHVALHGRVEYIHNRDWLTYITIEGMCYPGVDSTLFTLPYYYEIHNFFCSYIKEPLLDFEYSLFGFEAADSLGSDNIRDEISDEANILFEKREDDAEWFREKEGENISNNYYHLRAYYTGLAISEKLYHETGMPKEFVFFKPGYYWVPDTL